MEGELVNPRPRPYPPVPLHPDHPVSLVEPHPVQIAALAAVEGAVVGAVQHLDAEREEKNDPAFTILRSIGIVVPVSLSRFLQVLLSQFVGS